MLGTSVATANRALRILAERDIVVRRRNSGTFVGPAIESDEPVSQQAIVSIIAPERMRTDGSIRFDLIIQGILASFPHVADVRIGYVPNEGGVASAKRLIEPIRQAGQLAGVIAISLSRYIYRYLGESGCPLVVMGSLYSDQPYYSIDADEREAGRMLVNHLIERGHKKLAVFSDSEYCPGDNFFRDGVNESLTAANRSPSTLIWRTPGTDPAVLRAQLVELLTMPERPTGIVVKLPRWADEIAEIVQQRGLRVPDDIEIVFKGFAMGEAGKSKFPHACPSFPYRQIAGMVGQMLATQYERRPTDALAVVVPYEMRQSPQVGVVD
jgi:DNA-binding LacI/PurR family transcriptional regulator